MVPHSTLKNIQGLGIMPIDALRGGVVSGVPTERSLSTSSGLCLLKTSEKNLDRENWSIFSRPSFSVMLSDTL